MAVSIGIDMGQNIFVLAEGGDERALKVKHN